MCGVVPFDFFIFKKTSRALTYKMSDSLRSEYDAFGEYIFANTNSNNVRNAIVMLKTNYQLVYSKLERELIDSGNKKSKHCYEELSLVFQFMYQLLSIDSTLSQQTLGEIFSFKPTDFAKLGIYPLRAYGYYRNMFQDKGLFGKSKISGVVNSKVQVPLLCRSQVVVSNDSDLFVNLVQGDNKMFFVTRPADISADTIGDLMYSLARFSFCNVNNGVKSQKFKDKVVDVLDIKDTVIAEQFLIGILQSDVELSECVRDGNAYEFNEMRKELKFPSIDGRKVKVPEVLIETFVNSIKICADNVVEYNIRINPNAKVDIPVIPDEEFNPQFHSAKVYIDNTDAVLIKEISVSYEDAKNYANKRKKKVKRVHFDKPVTIRVYANL